MKLINRNINDGKGSEETSSAVLHYYHTVPCIKQSTLNQRMYV